MGELPGGTVTLLFSDIEGSTRLLQRFGDRYAGLLEGHRELLRASFSARGGQEIDTQGDGFFVVFRRPADAVAAATAAQRALAEHPWPDGAALSVRIGLHTGQPTVAHGSYVGLDVHRAARLCSAGHGRQVLLSETTRDLVVGELPDGVGLRDLGEHWLRDMPRPEQLAQLVIPGLLSEFPPLRTFDAHRTNLPAQPGRLIGREREVAAAREQLLEREVDLLTLLGPPGIGKTRLAIAVAAELLASFEHNVTFVPLAPVRDPSLLITVIAQALGLRESGSGRLQERLTARFRERPGLLVLDNFEHLASAAPMIAELLADCPDLKVLVTSRAALRLSGEHEFPLSPLALPDLQRLPTLDELGCVPAVALFLQRAQAVRPSLALTLDNARPIAELCTRLEGLPLAIELAAARAKVLPPRQLLARLEGRLTLLTGGAQDWPARHRTLREAISWSYDLLDQAEQALFRRLAVFVGGWTLEAAEAVCAEGASDEEPGTSSDARRPTSDDVLDLLGQLVDKSLVQAGDQGEETRYRMLETVREYGWERLRAAGEDAALNRRHFDWCLELAERAEAECYGPAQAAWLERLRAEHGNLRAALAWLQAELGGATPRTAAVQADLEAGLRLAGALWRFWEMRGSLSEGRAVLGRLLALASERSPAWVRATTEAGFLAMLQGDLAAARAHAEAGLEAARELGDPLALMFLTTVLVNSAQDEADFRRAVAHLEECLAVARAKGSVFGVATSLYFQGQLALASGEYGRAEALYEQSLALARQQGDRWAIAHPLGRLGHLALLRGDYERATGLCHEGLAARRDLDDARGIPQCLDELAWIAAAEGRAERAARLLGAAEVLRERAGLALMPQFRPDHDRATATARAALGEPAFAAAWGTGRARPEETVEYALGTHELAASAAV